MIKLIRNSAAIKHSLTGTVLTVGLLITGTSQASAATIGATLTADNSYGLYYGEADGSGLTFVGRNEQGIDRSVPDTTRPIPPSSCSGFGWSCPEAWEFNADPGDRIYVIAWDWGGPQSWIGEFQTPDGLLLSNASDWEYTIGGPNPGWYGDVPSLTDLTNQIASATWSTPRSLGSNGTRWGRIPDISGSAEFIWSNSANDGNYMIFRTQEPVSPEPVPEPSSMLGLLAFGAFGAASQLLKGKRQ